MRLRRTLTIGAAALAAGLLGFTSTAQADDPTGGPIAEVMVNGDNTVGSDPIDGIFKSGTASFGGGTFGCSGGTADGIVRSGGHPPATGSDMEFSTLTISCDTPVGGDATISVNTGCTVDVDFADDNVHDGTVDTGTGTKFSRVDGEATMAPGCVEVSALSGFCTADVEGSVDAFFDEAIKDVGGVDYQDLILDGSGLQLTNQSGCLGLLTGNIDLNDITFNIQVSSGTTTGIDFRP